MKSKKEPNPIDKHVGSKIRMRRMMLDMSQTKLGDALGLSFQQVQKYEKGTNRVGASRLQAISNILGVQPSFFFEGAPIAGGVTPYEVGDKAVDHVDVDRFLATSDGLSLVRSFSAIESAKLRRRIVDMVEEIAGG